MGIVLIDAPPLCYHGSAPYRSIPMRKHLYFLKYPLIAFAASALMAGCGDDDGPSAPDPTPDPTPEDAVSDFSLPDVNPTSARFDDVVSPRDYRSGASAWYFGHAT